jgi:predicted transcriptional regulator of viral defense system
MVEPAHHPPATADSASRHGLDFGALYNIAVAHAGHFTTRQAAEVGFSPQALRKYLLAGRIVRVLHGIYRLVHFPADDLEQLAMLDLWADTKGTFSHETALAAHGLSDAMPAQVHMTLPATWRSRRLKVPPVLVVHFADVTDADRTWYGPVRVTLVARTIEDCARSHSRPDLVVQAYEQATARGLLTEAADRRLGDLLAPWLGPKRHS